MKKLSILVVSALSLSLLLVGGAFADQDTLRNQDNFQSSAPVFHASSDMADSGFYYSAEDQVGGLTTNPGLRSNPDSISSMNEHYGQAPSWNNIDQGQAEEEIIDGH